LSNIVLYKLDDSIATITMDDGKVNVMSLVMISELNKAMPNVAIEICRQRLAPAHFQPCGNQRRVVWAQPGGHGRFPRSDCARGGSVECGQSAAAQLGKLNIAAHTATKLRAREQTLKAIRRAIEIDDAAFRAAGG
jgi:hypothetical protein